MLLKKIAETSRIMRERKTIKLMIELYCNALHKTQVGLCDDCILVDNYSQERITKCKFILKKPTCGSCTVHCYRKDFREMIRKIMRFAGPRMLLHHPVLSFLHLVDNAKSMSRVNAREKYLSS